MGNKNTPEGVSLSGCENSQAFQVASCATLRYSAEMLMLRRFASALNHSCVVTSTLIRNDTILVRAGLRPAPLRVPPCCEAFIFYSLSLLSAIHSRLESDNQHLVTLAIFQRWPVS